MILQAAATVGLLRVPAGAEPGRLPRCYLILIERQGGFLDLCCLAKPGPRLSATCLFAAPSWTQASGLVWPGSLLLKFLEMQSVSKAAGRLVARHR